MGDGWSERGRLSFLSFSSSPFFFSSLLLFFLLPSWFCSCVLPFLSVLVLSPPPSRASPPVPSLPVPVVSLLLPPLSPFLRLPLLPIPTSSGHPKPESPLPLWAQHPCHLGKLKSWHCLADKSVTHLLGVDHWHHLQLPAARRSHLRIIFFTFFFNCDTSGCIPLIVVSWPGGQPQ